LKSKFGNRLRLLYTDTDSFIFKVATGDLYADMTSMMHELDTSDYPLCHPLYSATNKKTIGKFKDETNGVPISEFICLKAKMYSILLKKQSKFVSHCKAKGLSHAVVSNTFHFDMYRSALKVDHIPTMVKQNAIRAQQHNLFSIEINKLGLHCFDDKRFICDNSVSTFAHGHYKSCLTQQ
jgi:hypothetical protein